MKQSEALVIGCGFAGIAAARALRRAGVSYTVLEAGSSIGGVWRDNIYPGISCDTPSHMYSYSYARWAWSRSHAKGAEIVKYLEFVARRYDVLKNVKFGIRVIAVTWDPATEHYEVEASDGHLYRFRYVISAVGLLGRPFVPDLSGVAEFRGVSMHTSEWRTDISMTGKRVALIGTGSTGVQLLPEIVKDAAYVYQFQREPGYILPKMVNVYDADEVQKNANRLWYRFMRAKAYVRRHTSKGPTAFRPGTRQNHAAREQCIAFIESVLNERPDLVEALTPSYPFGGKRPVSAGADYFESFLRPNVELVPKAVAALNSEGIVTSDGQSYPVDVIVYATGFRPTEFLASYAVVGENSTGLREFWGDEPRAFLGIMVPNFPNFFIMYGPNTNGMGLVFMLEQQARFIEKTLIRSRRFGRPGTVRVKASWYRLYNKWLDRRLARTVWVDANNYYKTASGYIATQYPEGMPVYWLHTRLLRRAGTQVSGRGSGNSALAKSVLVGHEKE
jgi:cation diffusion facilitator CzcD-associated flavoprotein CzcO